MLETILATLISYIGTNIDDMFINTLFFAQTNTKQQVRAVVAGKYLGIGALVLLSLLGARGLQAVPQTWIGLLGFVPMALGVKAWISAPKKGHDPSSEDSQKKSDPAKGLVLHVMLVTMANGADNIGVYIPLFATYSLLQMAVVVVIFALMIALWCFLGKKLADLPALRGFLLKYEDVIVPVVLIALGIYILCKSGPF